MHLCHIDFIKINVFKRKLFICKFSVGIDHSAGGISRNFCVVMQTSDYQRVHNTKAKNRKRFSFVYSSNHYCAVYPYFTVAKLETSQILEMV